MSRQTTNYGFNISEGTDLVNPLTDIFPNFEDIDTDLKDVSDSAVGTATELLTGTVHALVRSDSDRNVFTFTATSNFEAGETFTLDGVQVTALTPDGQTLSSGCYIIGSEVLVAVKGTLMTVYVNPSKALDSDKLDGHDSSYFANASNVSDLSDDVGALSQKVGSGTLTIGDDCVDGINQLNTQLSNKENVISVYDGLAISSATAWTEVTLANGKLFSDYQDLIISVASNGSNADNGVINIPVNYFKAKNSNANYLGGYQQTSSGLISYGVYYSADNKAYMFVNNTNFHVSITGLK